MLLTRTLKPDHAELEAQLRHRHLRSHSQHLFRCQLPQPNCQRSNRLGGRSGQARVRCFHAMGESPEVYPLRRRPSRPWNMVFLRTQKLAFEAQSRTSQRSCSAASWNGSSPAWAPADRSTQWRNRQSIESDHRSSTAVRSKSHHTICQLEKTRVGN